MNYNLDPMSLRFELIHQSTRSQARVGKIHTPHGVIDTPGFVAVGTNGTLKSLDNQTVVDAGLQLMFCNTYHLMLQPGTAVVKAAGGLHKFIKRDRPIITDSGGFQVFSLAYGGVASELKSQGTKKTGGSVLKIDEEGVVFRSYRDGAKIKLTAESSVQAQKDLGADIIIPFDELPPYHIEKSLLIESLERTHRWEKRSLDYHLKNPQNQAMYAVIHGGVDEALRQQSARFADALPFDGFAIGGSLGKTKDQLFEVLKYTCGHLDPKRPRHLLGIGDLESIYESVKWGLDTFDSSYPTRSARHGVVHTAKGPLNFTLGSQRTNFNPIDTTCTCHTCKNFTVAYLHHLFKAKEATVLTLASLHNLTQMVRIMNDIREAILNNHI